MKRIEIKVEKHVRFKVVKLEKTITFLLLFLFQCQPHPTPTTSLCVDLVNPTGTTKKYLF
jgi:hypothetical protein